MKRYWAEFTSEDFATFDVGRLKLAQSSLLR